MTKQELESKIEQCRVDEESIRKNREELEQQLNKMEVRYHIGQRFRINEGVCILAAVRVREVCLIFLHNGNRWRDPVRVGDVYSVTQEEMYNVIGKHHRYEVLS